MNGKIGKSTVVRVAGNILSGHRPVVPSQPAKLSEVDRQLIAWALMMAREIVRQEEAESEQ